MRRLHRPAVFCPVAILLASLLPWCAAHAAGVTTVTGAGATFPAPLYLKWAEAFGRETGTLVSYEGVGSGDGIRNMEAGIVTFGASDQPLPPSELARQHLVQFPTLIGGVLAVINLPGFDPGVLAVDGRTLARIMAGEVTRWDAPEIARLNPTVHLPPLDIALIHRSDASGTTFVLAGYLGRVAGGWIGHGSTIPWRTGTGVAGSGGMIEAVRRTEGAIGYVDYADAKRAGLSYLDLVNRDGRVVQPTPSSFLAASTHTDLASGDFSLVDAPGAASWPITAATFVLMRADPVDPEASTAALRFFDWGYGRGASLVEDLDYVPLSDDAVKVIHKVWAPLRFHLSRARRTSLARTVGRQP